MIGIERRNTRLWHTSNAVLRLAVLRGATRPFARNAIVNEYPKSGGTWLSQMLARALDLPFPRNRLPMIGSCLMQCHVLNPVGMKNVTVIWRDGRDVMVSFYHHHMMGHEFADPAKTLRNAERIGISEPQDVENNLPRFIEALFQREIGPSFTWAEFVDVWSGRGDVVETRYEDLLKNAEAELQRISEVLTGTAIDPQRAAEIVDQFSFARQTGRQPGQETPGASFLRKGIAGNWASVFSPRAEEVFDHYAGAQLRRLGYL